MYHIFNIKQYSTVDMVIITEYNNIMKTIYTLNKTPKSLNAQTVLY